VYGHIVKGLNEGPENLFFRNVFLDAAQLAGIMMDMEQVDENRVGAMGGSQGGALTLACASLEPRIAIAAPRFPWLCDYKRVWDMDLDDRAYKGLRDYFRHFDPTHEKEEEIFTLYSPTSIRLERSDYCLRMLQRIRDEAHRFAITYHRNLREKTIRESVLDEIPGIGPAKKIALLKKFNSIYGIARADVDEIAKVAKVGKVIAEAVKNAVRNIVGN
jgi:hypothetical protein